MSAPYEDGPLMIITGAIGLWFGVLGIRAILAQRRERKAIPPPSAEPEPQTWDEAVPVRRTRGRSQS